MSPSLGVLPVHKPVGPTSHDVVSRIRRVAGMRRVGHAGTLDPFASGLLLILLGEATRLSEYLLGLDKSYEAVARLGVETDTHDPEGEVVSDSSGWADLSESDVSGALEGFRGAILQKPPRYSSKKVGGEAAHRRARRGEEVALSPVPVEIHEISLLAFSPPEVRFRVRCSSGTYIRSLARDLGRALGVGAHLTHLLRTEIGGFHLDGSLPLEEIRDAAALEGAVIPPADALLHLPAVEISVEDARRFRQGQFIPLPGEEVPEGDPVRVLLNGELLAVGMRQGEELRPRKVLGNG